MLDRRFDSVAKVVGGSVSRRSLIKTVFGSGAVAATATVAHNRAEAARRGFSGPSFPWAPTPTPTCEPDGQFCDIYQQSSCCSGKCIYNPLSPTGGYCVS